MCKLTVIHDGRRDVLARDSLGPGSFDVQIQTRLSAILAGVFLRNMNY